MLGSLLKNVMNCRLEGPEPSGNCDKLKGSGMCFDPNEKQINSTGVSGPNGEQTKPKEGIII